MSKNHPKIYTKHPNGGYGDKQRDLALLNTWPRYWQKGRVKRRQNSLHVYPRLKKGAFNFQAVGTCTFLSPEAAHRLVRTKNHDLCKYPKSTFQGIPVTLRMLGFKSDKSDWLRVRNEFSVHAQKNWTSPDVAIVSADQKERASGDEKDHNGRDTTSWGLCKGREICY